MARGIATCKCQTCGEEFEKIKIDKRWNRKDVQSWEEWASWYYTQCPSCYRKEQIEKTKNGALEKGFKLVKMKYGEYMTYYHSCEVVNDSYDASSKNIEVILDNEQYEKFISDK